MIRVPTAPQTDAPQGAGLSGRSAGVPSGRTGTVLAPQNRNLASPEMFGSSAGKALQQLGRSIEGGANALAGTAAKILDQETAADVMRAETELLNQYSEFTRSIATDNDPGTWHERYQQFTQKNREKLFTRPDGKAVSKAARQKIELNAADFVARSSNRLAESGLEEVIRRNRQAGFNLAAQKARDGDVFGAEEVIDALVATNGLAPEDGEARKARLRPQANYEAALGLINADPELALKRFGERNESDGRNPHYPHLDNQTLRRLSYQAKEEAGFRRNQRYDQLIASIDDKTIQAGAIDDFLARGDITRKQAASAKKLYFDLNPPEFNAERRALFHDLEERIRGLDTGLDSASFIDETNAIKAEVITNYRDAHKEHLLGMLDDRQDSRGKRIKAASDSGSDYLRDAYNSGLFGQKTTFTGADEEILDEGTLIRFSRAQEQFDAWVAQKNGVFTRDEAIKEASRIIDDATAEEDLSRGVENLTPARSNPSRGALLGQPPQTRTTMNIRQSAPQVNHETLAVSLPAPLAKHAKDFVDAGNRYGIDPKFLAAVSMVETGHGTSKAFRVKNNAMGASTNKGPIAFDNPRSSIFRMAKVLADPDGPYRNADTIAEIAPIYSPPGAGNDVHGTNHKWPALVADLYAKL